MERFGPMPLHHAPRVLRSVTALRGDSKAYRNKSCLSVSSPDRIRRVWHFPNAASGVLRGTCADRWVSDSLYRTLKDTQVSEAQQNATHYYRIASAALLPGLGAEDLAALQIVLVDLVVSEFNFLQQLSSLMIPDRLGKVVESVT